MLETRKTTVVVLRVIQPLNSPFLARSIEGLNPGGSKERDALFYALEFKPYKAGKREFKDWNIA